MMSIVPQIRIYAAIPLYMVRSFLAVPFHPDEDFLSIVNEVKENYGREVRIPDTSNMHITLDFFADITERQALERWENLNIRAFENSILSPTGIGHFPEGKKTRVLFLDLNRELFMKKDESIYLENKFSWSYSEFHPHVTVCRFKFPGDTLLLEEKYKNHAFKKQKSEKIMLIKSILGQSGPTYTVIKETQLI